MDMSSWWKEKQPNYNKIFSALTLTTPELTSELHKLEEEEQRKENLHQKTLTNLLPWETHEVESKILEEECKDSILNLSKDDKTFISSVKPEEEAVLPELLTDFDLDLHFSLIKRMLAVDPNLVEMQAQLSGKYTSITHHTPNQLMHLSKAPGHKKKNSGKITFNAVH